MCNYYNYIIGYRYEGTINKMQFVIWTQEKLTSNCLHFIGPKMYVQKVQQSFIIEQNIYLNYYFFI